MPPLTYATCLPYLLGLGVRFSEIGRSELTLTGQASDKARYPLLLVEAEMFGNETTPGSDTFTVAVQVLTKPERFDEAQVLALLDQTNTWVDCLTQQLRDERGGQLASVSKLPLPGQAGADMAIGWRVELQLKLAKGIDRNANKDLFTPEV
jgi:hypothetical protein